MSLPRSYSSRHASPAGFRYQPYPSPQADIGQGWPSRQRSYPPSRTSSSSSFSQEPISFGQDPDLELPPIHGVFATQDFLSRAQSPLLNTVEDDWQQGSSQVPAREPRASSASLSGPISVADVERVAGRFGVCGNKLQHFNSLPPAQKPIEIYGLLLQQQNEAAETRKILGDIMNQVSATADSVSNDFKPSKIATKHMRRMTRHYLVQPLRSYYGLHSATKNYYLGRPAENHPLQVAAYPSNSTVKNIIHQHLKEYAGQARSNMRKLIWRFVKERIKLSVWTKFMMDHYWFQSPEQTAAAPKMLQAPLALMRAVAAPLVALPTRKGQNTNFWKLVNGELVRLYGLYGETTAAAAWELWADEIITKDKAMYTVIPDGELQAPSDDEDDDVPLTA